MIRKVFFSYDISDVTRALLIRNSWEDHNRIAAGVIDVAAFKKLEMQGVDALMNWIDNELRETSVTVLLVGEKTCSNKWVQYEIAKSVEMGNGLLGIDVSKIKDINGNTSVRCGKIPKGYNFYMWNKDEGYNNLDVWIERAVKDAGR